MGNRVSEFEESIRDYSDFRSSSKDTRRQREQKQKYYGYRGSNPSMVGQKCYTRTAVVSDSSTNFPETSRKRCRIGRKRQSLVEEVESPNVMKALRKQCLRYMWDWLEDSDSALIAAAAMADRTRRLSNAPTPVENSIFSCSFLDQLLKDTKLRAAQALNSYGICPGLPVNDNIRVRLKVRNWTKKDNYENRIAFKDHYYIGRRHCSRKFSPDGKQYKRMTLREMGRDTKSKSRLVGKYESTVPARELLDEANTTQRKMPSRGCREGHCLILIEELSEGNKELMQILREAQNASVEDFLETFVAAEADLWARETTALDVYTNTDVTVVEDADLTSSLRWPIDDWTLCSPVDAVNDLDVMSVSETGFESDWEELIYIDGT